MCIRDSDNPGALCLFIFLGTALTSSILMQSAGPSLTSTDILWSHSFSSFISISMYSFHESLIPLSSTITFPESNKRKVSQNQQVATVMVASSCISTAAEIGPLYSLGGADVHPHLIHGYLGPHESSSLVVQSFLQSSGVVGPTQTTLHATQYSEIYYMSLYVIWDINTTHDSCVPFNLKKQL